MKNAESYFNPITFRSEQQESQCIYAVVELWIAESSTKYIELRESFKVS